MVYPFEIKKNEHRVYSKTFLQNTVVELTFPTLFEEKDKSFPFPSLYTYIDKFFHLQLNAEPDMDKGFSLDNKANDVTISFKKDAVGIRVGRKNYQSFVSSVMPYVYLLKSYVKETMGIDGVESIVVRKINLWPFPSDVIEEQNVAEEAMFSAVFSDEFLKASENVASDNLLPLTVSYEEKEISLFLSRSINEDDNHKVVILDSKVESQQTTSTSINEIETKLEELNDILFASFHWCVSDEILKIMEG